MFCGAVAIRQLRGLQIGEHAADILVRARRQQAAGRFHHVARPYQMVAAEVVIPFAKSPRNRKAGDEAARSQLGLVGAQDRQADPGKVALGQSFLCQ